MKQKNSTGFILTFIFLFVFDFVVNAQVTIGSDDPPAKAALLDIKDRKPGSDYISSGTGGLLLPRVKLTSLTSLAPLYDNYDALSASEKTKESLLHTGLSVYHLDNSSNRTIESGIYVWSDDKWNRLDKQTPVINFFYMPSFIIDTSSPGNTARTINLYNEYRTKFSSPAVKSNASATLPVLEADQLHYFVIDYDRDVLEIDPSTGLSATGVLTYKVIAVSTASTYINVAFSIK